MILKSILRALAVAAGLLSILSVVLCFVLPIWITVGLTPRAIVITLASIGLWVCFLRLERRIGRP